jgi:hypothetical protein
MLDHLWQAQTFKFSTDPQLEAILRGVVGLYLDPPEHAIVVCVDEKPQIQALDLMAWLGDLWSGPSGGSALARPDRMEA